MANSCISWTGDIRPAVFTQVSQHTVCTSVTAANPAQRTCVERRGLASVSHHGPYTAPQDGAYAGSAMELGSRCHLHGAPKTEHGLVLPRRKLDITPNVMVRLFHGVGVSFRSGVLSGQPQHAHEPRPGPDCHNGEDVGLHCQSVQLPHGTGLDSGTCCCDRRPDIRPAVVTGDLIFGLLFLEDLPAVRGLPNDTEG